jgi:hypothetical protein
MSSATLVKLRINNAEQFKESVSEPSPNTNLYLVYGRAIPWANDSEPPAANTSVATEYEIWNNMIGGKRITGNEIRHVIPRYNWASDTKYIAYDHMDPNLYGSNVRFYVVTQDFNVYKCLSNNYSSNSTVEPTSISATTISQTADGYTWKYMYTLSEEEKLNFTTSSYIPVKTIGSDDGSLQWAVQTDAIEGAIDTILVTNGGSGYTNVSNLSVTITGDGAGATATASINTVSNVVSNVTVTNYGSEYTQAVVTISGGGGTGATARAIIPPPGGHGSDPLYELGGFNVMVNAKIRNSENGILPTSNDFRQIGIIKDPYILDTTEVATNTAFFQGETLTTAGSGDFTVDEFVYQGTTLAASTFNARVLEWDSANGIVKVVNITGTPLAGTLIGATSSTTRFVTSVDDVDFHPFSGQLLYIDNVKPIIRSIDQTESFRIVLKF